MVFGNVEAIYEWHREWVFLFRIFLQIFTNLFSFLSIFLKSLQNCVQNPCELSAIINRNRAKLRMYVVYCQNKPVSEHIVQEHFSYFEEIKKKLEHKLLVSPSLFCFFILSLFLAHYSPFWLLFIIIIYSFFCNLFLFFTFSLCFPDSLIIF